MLTILFDEIKQIKIKGLPKAFANENENKKNEENKNEIIDKLSQRIEQLEFKMNELIKKNEENDKEKKDMELKIKLLTDENQKMKDNLNKYTVFLDERMKEIKKEKN